MNAFIKQSTSPAVGVNPAIAANPQFTTKQVSRLVTLDQLAAEFQKMKDFEAQAKERRIEIEHQIIQLVGVEEEGTTNVETEAFKFKTVGKLTRSLDDKAIQSDWDKLPDEIKQCVTFKASLNTTKLRALESMRDDLMPVMAQYMTTKPAKPSVSVEVK